MVLRNRPANIWSNAIGPIRQPHEISQDIFAKPPDNQNRGCPPGIAHRLCEILEDVSRNYAFDNARSTRCRQQEACIVSKMALPSGRRPNVELQRGSAKIVQSSADVEPIGYSGGTRLEAAAGNRQSGFRLCGTFSRSATEVSESSRSTINAQSSSLRCSGHKFGP